MDCEVEILSGAFRFSIKFLIGDVFSPLGSVDLGRPLTRGDDLADHVAEDVGQPEIAASMTEGEAFMVEAQELQHGRMQVVN